MTDTRTPKTHGQRRWQLLQGEQHRLQVISTTGNRVVIKFAGVLEEFWFRAGQEPVRTPNSSGLNQHDERVLFELATRCQKASAAGYKQSTRKRTVQATPAPVVNKLSSRSAARLARARQSMLYEVCNAWLAGDPTFVVESLTGSDCVFGYCGSVVRLTQKPQEPLPQCSTRAWLGENWYPFVRLFGAQLLNAAVQGYRSTQPPKQVRGLSDAERVMLTQMSFKF